MKNVTEFGMNAARGFAKMGCDAAQLKSEFVDVAKSARRAAEDFTDDMTHAVKKQPLKYLGITFGIALGLGIFSGWLLRRK